MDSSHSIEMDTIRDKMESGYVATRPRFTRARRSWKGNIRNLTAADVLALELFAMHTTQRGALAFYFPNQLYNGSFEMPLPAGTVLNSASTNPPYLVAPGWNGDPTGVLAPFLSEVVNDTFVLPGSASLCVSTVDGYSTTVSAASTLFQGFVGSDILPVTPGEVYAITAQVYSNLGTAVDLATISPQAQIFARFLSNGNLISQVADTLENYGGSPAWVEHYLSATVPAGANQMQILLSPQFTTNATFTGTLVLNGFPQWFFDSVAVALVTPNQPLGRMVGSQPLGCAVRFTKVPEFSDMGYGGGVKVYGCSFEIEEV